MPDWMIWILVSFIVLGIGTVITVAIIGIRILIKKYFRKETK